MMMSSTRFAAAALFLALTLQAYGSETPPATAPAATPAGPVASRRLLLDGHARYREGGLSRQNLSQQRRVQTVKHGQHPYAIILSCADSRVPLELIFDAGIGDLFVARVAGNVASTDEIGTIEYGVEHLHVPLVVVLGHSGCGAVTAVVEHAHVSENVQKLVAPIGPAVETARSQHPDVAGAPLVAAAIEQNVRQAINDLLSRSRIVREAAATGQVQIIGGVYDLSTGDIDWIESAAHASGTGGHAHDSHDGPHAKNTHGSTDAHDASNKKPEIRTPAAVKENFAALGALLGAAALVSTLAIRYLFGRE